MERKKTPLEPIVEARNTIDYVARSQSVTTLGSLTRARMAVEFLIGEKRTQVNSGVSSEPRSESVRTDGDDDFAFLAGRSLDNLTLKDLEAGLLAINKRIQIKIREL